MKKYIIVDDFDNHCFSAHEFNNTEDAWEFLYLKFPVIYNEDGTQDDQEDELGSYWVIEKDK